MAKTMRDVADAYASRYDSAAGAILQACPADAVEQIEALRVELEQARVPIDRISYEEGRAAGRRECAEQIKLLREALDDTRRRLSWLYSALDGADLIADQHEGTQPTKNGNGGGA